MAPLLSFGAKYMGSPGNMIICKIGDKLVSKIN